MSMGTVNCCWLSVSLVYTIFFKKQKDPSRKKPHSHPHDDSVCHQLLVLLLLLLAVCGRSIIVCIEIWPSLHGPSPPLHSGFFLSFLPSFLYTAVHMEQELQQVEKYGKHYRMHDDGSYTGFGVGELQRSLVSRDLQQQTRRQDHEQNHCNHQSCHVHHFCCCCWSTHTSGDQINCYPRNKKHNTKIFTKTQIEFPNTTNVHKNTNWVLNHISTIMGMQN